MLTGETRPSAEALVKARIRAAGRITFAELMELALYGEGGYYTRGEHIGGHGDYYTSPSAHPVFGALIALQLEEMWAMLAKPSRFSAVEAGAGAGTLARDIFAFAQHLTPEFREALQYTAVDPRAGSTGTPQAAGLHFVASRGMPVGGIIGCIFSNELIDSLPVHRVSMRNGRLKELYVTIEKGNFVEVWDEPSTSEIASRIELERATLEEGCEGEVNLAAARWVEDAADSLERGYVVTIDYGDLVERLYSRERRHGTVASYYRHALRSDPYIRIGEQDITAHANFTTLVQAGAARGLRPITLMTQGELLGHLGIGLFIEAVGRSGLSDMERQANTMAMRDLVKADGLGKFRVLIQGKDTPAASLASLGDRASFREALRRRIESWTLPLLDEQHINLMAGKYPTPDETWVTGTWDSVLGED